MQQILYLRRLRDFGEKISDTFLFLKRNWKKLLGLYAVFVVPLLLIAIILATFFANRLYSASLSSALPFSYTDFLSVELFVIILCILLSGSAYNTAVFSYFRLYDEQKGLQPTLQQVGQLFMKKVLKVFFYNLVVMIAMLIIAVLPIFVLIKIPVLGVLILFFGGILAILFGVVLVSYLNCIFVTDDYGLGGSVTRLFYLMGNRWWNTIGFSIVIMLIYYVFSFVIQFVATMVGSVFSFSFLTPRVDGVAGGSHAMVTLAVVLIGLLLVVNQVFYIILFCGVGVNYYSLAEEKDGSAIEAQIDSIGERADKYGGIEEQY